MLSDEGGERLHRDSVRGIGNGSLKKERRERKEKNSLAIRSG